MKKRIALFGFLCLSLFAGACSAGSSGWTTYRDASFAISYPGDYTLDPSLGAETGKGVHAIFFRVPARWVTGTNLSPDSRLSVEILPAATACTPDLFLDNVTGYYVEKVGPLTFNIAKSGEAGAGNFYEDDVYAVAGSKPCVAVRYFVHSHNIMNYDPGAVRAYDANGLIREFDAIRSTLVVRRTK